MAEAPKARGKAKVTFEAALAGASQVEKETIIEVVRKQAKATTNNALIDALAGIIASPLARARLMEDEAFADLKEAVEAEKRQAKVKAAVASLEKAGLTKEEILAALRS